MPRVLSRLLGFLLGLTLISGAAAQQKPGSNLRIFLLTMGQGDEVYERFGHNAIWVHDESDGSDIAYNWGEFNLRQPGFYRRFLKGTMMYTMGGHPMDAMIYSYTQWQRTMWSQELNLTPAQRKAVQDYIRWNERPENREYHYDYYRDNCATRVRDIIDRALGGTLKRQLAKEQTEQTYRSETRRLMLNDIGPKDAPPPHATLYKVMNVGLMTGIDLALGPGIDQPLSAWETAFIPMELQSYLRRVTVPGLNGQLQPLVLNERVLVDAHRIPPSDHPPTILGWYFLAGLLIAALFAATGMSAGRAGRTVFLVLASLWSLLIGALGTMVAYLWVFTDHVLTHGNENLLQANPIALLLGVALIGLAFRSARFRTLALRTSIAVAGLAVLGFAIQILPGIDQVNGTIIALLLPSWVAIAWVTQKWPA